jgi:hypothetical protein
MKKYFLMIIALLLLTAIKTFEQSPALSQTNNQANFTYKIIDALQHTYGYDVYAGNKLLVHQASIPAMPGNKGFAAKTDAVKVAELVIEKLKKGVMPPTVTKEELQKLKVIS